MTSQRAAARQMSAVSVRSALSLGALIPREVRSDKLLDALHAAAQRYLDSLGPAAAGAWHLRVELNRTSVPGDE